MIFDFFEGAAGTGKTHNLVERAAELVRGGVLGDGYRLLALTFMNGARRRLDARLDANPVFRRRFDCQTFDVFARVLSARRRSLITPLMQERAGTLNAFDGPCCAAASLLETPAVSRWVARGFPLVVVDEAQDLDEHRLRIFQGLSRSCNIVAAADAFQCLTDGRSTKQVMDWLEGVGQTHRLTQPMRTSQQGLLAAALAVREGRDIKSALKRSYLAQNPTWNGKGFRLVETHASNVGLVAWTIANEMSQRSGQFAILTPDARNASLRNAIETVNTRVWTRSNGQTFGPYPHTWDRQDAEVADALLSEIALPDTATFTDLRTILAPLAEHACIAQAISRMDRLRQVGGQNGFSAARVIEFVRDAVRNQSRLGFSRRADLAMTIQRAKNICAGCSITQSRAHRTIAVSLCSARDD
jgi:hypothetical protein